jgi:hypothetical protein
LEIDIVSYQNRRLVALEMSQPYKKQEVFNAQRNGTLKTTEQMTAWTLFAANGKKCKSSLQRRRQRKTRKLKTSETRAPGRVF